MVLFRLPQRSEEASQSTCGSAAAAAADAAAADADAADITNFRTRDWLTFANLKCSKNLQKFFKKFSKNS